MVAVVERAKASAPLWDSVEYRNALWSLLEADEVWEKTVGEEIATLARGVEVDGDSGGRGSTECDEKTAAVSQTRRNRSEVERSY